MADKHRRRPSSRTLAVLVAIGNLVVCAAVLAAVACSAEDAPGDAFTQVTDLDGRPSDR